MIIFYEKETGNIVGTVHGRIHPESELKMWIGDKEKTERIICQWIENEKKDFIPEFDKDLFEELENVNLISRYYRVDLTNKKIIKKTKEEVEQEKINSVIVKNNRKSEKNKLEILEKKIQELQEKIASMDTNNK